MAGLLGRVAGGVLEGIGAGMVEQAKQSGMMEREARLAEMQHANRMTEMRAQQQHQTGERQATQAYTTERDAARFGQEKEMAGVQHGYRVSEIGAQAGATQANTRLANDLQAGRERDAHGRKLEEIDRTADAKARARRSMLDSTEGLSPDDKRQFNSLEKLYGDDPAALTRALKESGNPRLAALANGEAPPKGATMGADDQRVYSAAVQRNTDATGMTNWTAVGRDLRGLGREDLAKIAIGSPDPSAWQKVEIPEGYRAPSGGGAQQQPATPAASQPAQQQPPASAAKPPAGSGTKDAPYQAATQADIDWFKTSAPAGAIISINGQLYKK